LDGLPGLLFVDAAPAWRADVTLLDVGRLGGSRKCGTGLLAGSRFLLLLLVPATMDADGYGLAGRSVGQHDLAVRDARCPFDSL
jgi:hypothetical protein